MTRGALIRRWGLVAVMLRALLYVPLAAAELAGDREIGMAVLLDVPAVLLKVLIGSVLSLFSISLRVSSVLDIDWHIIGFTAWFLVGAGFGWLYVSVRGKRGQGRGERKRTESVGDPGLRR